MTGVTDELQDWCLQNDLSSNVCVSLKDAGFATPEQLKQSKSKVIIDLLSSIEQFESSQQTQIAFLTAVVELKKPQFQHFSDSSDEDECYDDDDSECECECEEEEEEDDTIGFAVGGAKDVNTFRENILQGYMPRSSSITYNGLFNEYFFDTKSNRRSLLNEGGDDNTNTGKNTLFYPSYCYAKCVQCPVFAKLDKIKANNPDHYLTIGLNSNIKQSEFKRFKLNLVIVLDKSGSMSSTFERFGSGTNTKMKIANNAVISLLKHLNEHDRFGLVTFNNSSQVVQPLKSMSDLNRNRKALENTISRIREGGGTNFEQGFNGAIALYKEFWKTEKKKKKKPTSTSKSKSNTNKDDEAEQKSMFDVYENRIIYLTDACPNQQNSNLSNSQSLLSLVKRFSEQRNHRVYTTFIGVGLDFNSGLVEQIGATRGCNYYSVHSNEQFREQMDDQFEYMVTPLVFNVSLRISAEGGAPIVEHVFGSNAKKEAMLTQGIVRKIDTLFPSKRKKKKGVRGGVVLLQLHSQAEMKQDNYTLNMEVKYEDRDGELYDNKQLVSLEINPKTGVHDRFNGDYFDNLGVRKAVLLKNYVLLIKRWISEQGDGVNMAYGAAAALQVSDDWKSRFNQFAVYFEKQMLKCEDADLKRELFLMRNLVQYNTQIAQLIRTLIGYDQYVVDVETQSKMN